MGKIEMKLEKDIKKKVWSQYYPKSCRSNCKNGDSPARKTKNVTREKIGKMPSGFTKKVISSMFDK